MSENKLIYVFYYSNILLISNLRKHEENKKSFFFNVETVGRILSFLESLLWSFILKEKIHLEILVFLEIVEFFLRRRSLYFVAEVSFATEGGRRKK